IFESPIFFEVLPENALKLRPLVQNSAAGSSLQLHHLDVLKRQLGPHRRHITRDKAGGIVEVEQGQAVSRNNTLTDSVIIAQNGSPVYYDIVVNDVFAFFRACFTAESCTSKSFPTTKAELDAIAEFTTAQGKKLVHPETLAMEVKTSWIEAD